MKAILIFLLLMSNICWGEVNMVCVTEIPTTSTVMKTSGQVVEFELFHHNSVKFMPIHNGLITPYDLATLTERADVLADLGDYLKFTLPAKACQENGFLVDCFGKSSVLEINGHKVHLWAAYSTQYEEKSFAGNFSYVTTNLALEVDGKNYFIPMKYSEGECELGMSKNKKSSDLLRKHFNSRR